MMGTAAGSLKFPEPSRVAELLGSMAWNLLKLAPPGSCKGRRST